MALRIKTKRILENTMVPGAVRILLAAAAFALLAVCSADASQGREPRRKMIVVLADHTALHDWLTPELPNLRGAMKRGAPGLMAVRMGAAPRTVDPDEGEAVPDTLYITDVKRRAGAHLSISAGAPAVQNKKARLAFPVYDSFAGRPVRRLYRDITGVPAPLIGIVNLGMARTAHGDGSVWKARPGLLGETLKNNGIRAAAVGNSDCRSRTSRLGTVLAADRNGFVARGSVGDAMSLGTPRQDDCCRADMDRLAEQVRKWHALSDFLVVEFCDTACASQWHIGEGDGGRPFMPYMTGPMRRLDALLGQILDMADLETTQVVILSPTPSVRDYAMKRALAPVLFVGNGVPQGCAVPAARSTRRPGLVVNLDLATHITRYFGIEPPADFMGADIAFVKRRAPITYLRNFAARNTFVESHGFLLRRAVTLHTVMILLCAFALFMKRPGAETWRQRLKFPMLFTMSVYLGFLLVAAFGGVRSDAGFYMILIGMCAAAAAAAHSAGSAARGLIILCGAYTVAIALDQVAGGPLIKNSVMGYFPQRGARFYGIGNEYAGALISAPVFLYGLLLDSEQRAAGRARRAFPFVFAFLVFVCASPFWGANFGATVSCSTAYLVMALLARGWRMRWFHIPLAALIAILALAFMALLDSLLPGGDSHVGELARRMMQSGGIQEAVDIAWRKITVNLRLMRVPVWSALFVVNLAFSILFLTRAPGRVRLAFERAPGVRRALAASLAGALMALAANDSGLVTAAVALCLPVLAVFLFAFERKAGASRAG